MSVRASAARGGAPPMAVAERESKRSVVVTITLEDSALIEVTDSYPSSDKVDDVITVEDSCPASMPPLGENTQPEEDSPEIKATQAALDAARSKLDAADAKLNELRIKRKKTSEDTIDLIGAHDRARARTRARTRARARTRTRARALALALARLDIGAPVEQLRVGGCPLSVRGRAVRRGDDRRVSSAARARASTTHLRYFAGRKRGGYGTNVRERSSFVGEEGGAVVRKKEGRKANDRVRGPRRRQESTTT